MLCESREIKSRQFNSTESKSKRGGDTSESILSDLPCAIGLNVVGGLLSTLFLGHVGQDQTTHAAGYTALDNV